MQNNQRDAADPQERKMEEGKVKTAGSDVSPAQSQLWLIDEEGKMFISTDAIDAALLVNIKISDCFPAAS